MRKEGGRTCPCEGADGEQTHGESWNANKEISTFLERGATRKEGAPRSLASNKSAMVPPTNVLPVEAASPPIKRHMIMVVICGDVSR